MNGKLLGVEKKWWLVAAVIGLLVFLYFRAHSQGKTAQQATGAADNTGGVDQAQLASDIAGQIGAALGGTPASTDSGAIAPTDNSALLAALAQQNGLSFSDFVNQLSALTAAGFSYDPSGASSGKTSSMTRNISAGGYEAGGVFPGLGGLGYSFGPGSPEVAGTMYANTGVIGFHQTAPVSIGPTVSYAGLPAFNPGPGSGPIVTSSVGRRLGFD